MKSDNVVQLSPTDTDIWAQIIEANPDLKRLIDGSVCSENWSQVIEKLARVSKGNETVLIEKFRGVTNESRLWDKILELLVAYSMLDQEPILSDEETRKPDFYLQSTSRFVEVKHLNESSQMEALQEVLRRTGSAAFGGVYPNGVQQAARLEQDAVAKKIKDLLEKALSQIDSAGESNGLVVLILSVDLASPGKSKTERENELREYAEKIFHEVSAQRSELQVWSEKELFQELGF